MQETLNITKSQLKFLDTNYKLIWVPIKKVKKTVNVIKKKDRAVTFAELESVVGTRAKFILKNLSEFKGDKTKIEVQNKGTIYAYGR